MPARTGKVQRFVQQQRRVIVIATSLGQYAERAERGGHSRLVAFGSPDFQRRVLQSLSVGVCSLAVRQRRDAVQRLAANAGIHPMSVCQATFEPGTPFGRSPTCEPEPAQRRREPQRVADALALR